jgi:pyruvate/2-oxoglutarate dehydrogenase complex dihydrolipoamide acyltransferase (E2) component
MFLAGYDMLLTIVQARDNKLTIEDLAGGTFTISNVSLLIPSC